jgi:hypothetical protein
MLKNIPHTICNLEHHEMIMVDSDDAPEGYIAVPKSSIQNHGKNLCESCDWREICSATICSCMSYGRKDAIGVVFKNEV